MKIAMTIYPLDNLGGIVSTTENLLFGLKENGHEVDFFLLGYQDKFLPPKYSDKELISRGDGWYKGFCCAVHQRNGWNFPHKNKLPYKGSKNIKETCSILKKYDFVFWQIPVPTQRKENKGNLDWIELYKANKYNYLYSHDAHMVQFYPHVYEILDYTAGFFSTNMASFNSVKIAGKPKALLIGGHNISKMEEVYEYEKRKDGWMSLQTFKAWKHTEDLIRAVPYMGDMVKWIAGGGREQAYMTSPDKCKPEYFASLKFDPKIKKKDIGKKIWDLAVEHGMKFYGWITPEKRDSMLKKIKTLIDPSWNLRFAKYGDHFNRVFLDSIKNGCIPIARNFGISSNKEGNGDIFKAGANYVMIPHDAKPYEFGQIVKEAQNLEKKKAHAMLKANYLAVKEVDRRACAKHVINMHRGKLTGCFGKTKLMKKTDPLIPAGSYQIMLDFFGSKNPKKADRSEGIGKWF